MEVIHSFTRRCAIGRAALSSALVPFPSAETDFRPRWAGPSCSQLEVLTMSKQRVRRFTPLVEALNQRVLPSVTSVFLDGTLTITGDDAADNVAIVSTAADAFTVTGGAEP